MCRQKLGHGVEAVTFLWPLDNVGKYAIVTDIVKDGVTAVSYETPLAKSYRSSSHVDKAELQEYHDLHVQDYQEE